jgi:hypothetical protein
VSDNPPAYPPPPSTGMTPPVPQTPLPPPPAYVQPYMQQQPYAPPPVGPSAGVMSGAMAGGLMYQLGGPAAWSIVFGLVSIVVPFAMNYYFPILPIAGAISAVRAIQRGRVIGGIIGIAVNVVGGLVTLLASGLIGG